MNTDVYYYCFECDEKFREDDSRLGDELFCPLCKSELESNPPPPKDLSSSDTTASFSKFDGISSVPNKFRFLIIVLTMLSLISLLGAFYWLYDIYQISKELNHYTIFAPRGAMIDVLETSLLGAQILSIGSLISSIIFGLPAIAIWLYLKKRKDKH